MMINQSILPFVTNRAYKHRLSRWYATGITGGILSPSGFLPTFQIIRSRNIGAQLVFILKDNESEVETDITADVNASGLLIDQTYDYDVIMYSATLPISVSGLSCYELIVRDGINEWFSEDFAMSDRTNEMLKLTYWHLEDLVFDQDETGKEYVVKYVAPFKNTLYVDTELFKPEYPYFREVERLLGRNFDKLHISAKEYRFQMLAIEETIDALRLIPLHDRKQVEIKGRSYTVDEMLITPDWQGQGDVALLNFTFRTNTVSIVGGRSSATVYEPTPGSCVALAHNCVGFIVEGSTNYNNYQYTDANGNTLDLSPGSKVLVQLSNGTLKVYQYVPTTYNLLSTAAQSVVFVQSNGLYYSGIGSNNVLLPAIQFYDSGNTLTVAGTFLNGATHNLYAISGVNETLVGSYTYQDLALDGVAITLPEGTDAIRFDIASGTCGIFQQTNVYQVPETGTGNQGIGFDTIGTTLKVY